MGADKREVIRQPRGSQGAGAAEYGVLTVAVAAVVVLLAAALGTYVEGSYRATCAGFRSVATPVPGPGGAAPKCGG